LIWLCACSSTSPCELEKVQFEEVLDCPDCGVGVFRHAYRADRGGELFISRGHVTYAATCAAITDLDDQGHIAGHKNLDLPDGTQMVTADGSDDTVYLGYRIAPEGGVGAIPYNLLALDANLDRRWERPYGSGSSAPETTSGGMPGPLLNEVRADREGAYLVGIAFDASDGSQRFGFQEREHFEADGQGGIFTGGPGVSAFDAYGVMRWTKPVAEAGVRELDATADGGVAIAGSFWGTQLDLGEVQLDAVPMSGSSITYFVALLDGNGATVWAHAMPDVAPGSALHIANLGGAAVAVAASAASHPNGYLAVVDASGPVRVWFGALAGWQRLLAAADGSVWSIAYHKGFQLGTDTRLAESADVVYVINVLP
jgi:hypothetical protein